MCEFAQQDDFYDFDVELFIALVEQQPVLWDKTLESYKSKTETIAAWREICNTLHPGFNQLSEEDRRNCSKLLTKRWTNLRDRYTKYLKKIEEQSSTVYKEKPVKKYIYSNQMSFLIKNTLKNKIVPSSCNMEEDIDAEPDQLSRDSNAPLDQQLQPDIQLSMNSDAPLEQQVERDVQNDPPAKKRAHQNYTLVERMVMNTLREKDNRHLHFFKGILPSLELLRDEEVIRFQIGVLNVLQDIHRTRQNT